MSPRHSKHQTNRPRLKTGQPERPAAQPLPFVDAAESTFFAPAVQEEARSQHSQQSIPPESTGTEMSLFGNTVEGVWPDGFRLDENTEGQIRRLKETSQVHRGNKSAPLPPEQVKLGSDYEVLALLGQGGMGFVYKVKDKRKNQVVAVKVIRPELAADQRALKRFEQEAEAAMGLIHPNLVPVYAQGMTADGAPYLVMEYQEGTPLDKVLKQEKCIKPDRAVDIFMQICEALDHAHAKGIVHRDLKPSNIVLTKTKGFKDLVRIVDFGIAKVLASPESRETFDLTHTGDLFGSPSYMSPEQCMGYRLDARSDVYSLGCVMYELLSGQPPFICDNPVQTIVKHLSEVPERLNKPQTVGKEIPGSLEALVLRCLEKDPRNRYQSMEQLRKDLSNIQTGERPVYARARESTEKKLPLAVKVAAIMLIDLFCLSAAFEQHEQVIGSVADARNVVSESETISKLFSEAVGNLRAYKTSKSPLFVDRYNASVSAIPPEVHSLYSYYPTNVMYQTNVQMVDSKVQEGLYYLKASKEIVDSDAAAAGGDAAAYKKYQELKGADSDGSKFSALDRDLLTTSFRIHDDLMGVTQEARRTIKSDPVSTSKHWLIAEVLALMLVNMMLVLGLGKRLGTEAKRRIWQSDASEY